MPPRPGRPVSFSPWRRVYFPILVGTIAEVICYFNITSSPVSVQIHSTLPPPPPQFNHQIFIAIFTGSNRTHVLSVQTQTHSWLLSQPYVAGLCFLGDVPVQTDNEVINRHYVAVVRTANDTSWNFLCTKVYVAVQLFLATPASWLLRICDDGMINPVTFPAFLSELNDFADPHTTRVIQGHLIAKPTVRKYVYPQGGSGIVFSRFAAEEIWRESAWFLFVCSHVRNDDRGIGLWMLMHDVSAWNSTNRWFVGHQFAGQGKGNAIAGFLRLLEGKVERCPRKPRAELGIRPFFARVKDITFWHGRGPFAEFGPKLEAARRALPENLFFYPNGEMPVLCFGTSKTQSRFYD